MGKRIFDVAIASLILIATLPLMIVTAIGIKLESHGALIIATRRVGKDFKIFAHYRFRTMAGEPLRKTRFGRFIGNLSLDDLPTFWNVVKGDMSLIGPRPEAPERVDANDSDWQRVLSIKPGLLGLGLLTFLAQYNQTSVKERIQPELYYVEHQSLWFDLQIFLRSLTLWVQMGHLKGKF